MRPDCDMALEAGLAWLEAEAQAGWSAIRLDSRGECREPDAFHIALVAETVWALGHSQPGWSGRARRLVEGAARKLDAFQAPGTGGGYRFWQDRGAADLDDTALALRVRDLAGLPRLPTARLVDLFGRCRVHGELAGPSRWAARFGGVYLTWLGAGPPVVDALVNQNVLRCLRQLDAAEVPGFREAVTMLSALRDVPWRDRYAPYYAARELRAWASNTPTGLLQRQQADGGWPAITTCQDLGGQPHWRSRAVATAFALSRLGTGRPPPLLTVVLFAEPADQAAAPTARPRHCSTETPLPC